MSQVSPNLSSRGRASDSGRGSIPGHFHPGFHVPGQCLSPFPPVNSEQVREGQTADGPHGVFTV